MTKEKGNFFDVLNERIREFENSFVNFLSVFAPWLAPVTPAYMTYRHALERLEFPQEFAFAAAVLVEIMGFTAVSTYMSFWFYNRRNSAASKKAPLILVVIAFGFYLALIVSSNILLDSFPESSWAIIVVRALYTLQTIPAALLVSVRTQHRELLSEIARERREKVSERSESSRKEEKEEQKVSGNLPKDWRNLRPLLTKEQVIDLANLSAEGVKKVSLQHSVDERTVVNWRKYARKELERE